MYAAEPCGLRPRGRPWHPYYTTFRPYAACLYGVCSSAQSGDLCRVPVGIQRDRPWTRV